MNGKWYVGHLVFFTLPLLLWAIGAAATRRKGKIARFFAFVGGSDNRLSLSRLQAFVWTLVIFGSFAAAIAIHPQITAGTKAEKDIAAENLKVATDALVAAKKAQETASANLQTAKNELDVASTVKAQAEAALNSLKANGGDVAKAEEALKNAAITFETKNNFQTYLAAVKENANKAVTAAQDSLVTATNESVKYNWVEIPPELLALAGIAIGSGIFSSLISNVNSEEKTACINSLRWLDGKTAKTNHQAKNLDDNKDYLLIEGTGFSKEGKVRLRQNQARTNQMVPTPYWESEGTLIVAEVPLNLNFTHLIADTPNGKLSHEVEIGEVEQKDPAGNVLKDTQGNILKIKKASLGEYKIHYEFADLFRDDKNPVAFDLMKFQMFGWTVIAVVIYTFLFLMDVWNKTPENPIQSLPLVPASIVILTGLSQAGYLGSKAISNTGKQ